MQNQVENSSQSSFILTIFMLKPEKQNKKSDLDSKNSE